MNPPVDGYSALADLLDRAFRIPGTNIRFGLDPVLGLVPGLGDALAAGVAGYLIVGAVRLGAPRSVVLRMLYNVVIDLVVGAVPLLGDAFDVGWKANTRNARLLAQVVAEPERTRAASRWFLVAVLGALLGATLASVALAALIVRAVVGLV